MNTWSKQENRDQTDMRKMETLSQTRGSKEFRHTYLQLQAIIIIIHIRIQEGHTSQSQPPPPLSHFALRASLHRLRRDSSSQPPNITRAHNPEGFEQGYNSADCLVAALVWTGYREYLQGVGITWVTAWGDLEFRKGELE